MGKTKLISQLVGCLFLLFLPFTGLAHEMRPALLQIKQTDAKTYEVLWKIPRVGNQVIALKPEFPSWFVLEQKTPASESGNGALYFFSARSIKDIHGMPIKIKGLELSVVDVLVQVELLSGEQYSLVIQPGTKKAFIPADYGITDTIYGYLILGVNHILSGLDHLLFVLALMLITKGRKKLFITVTAFTLAHSITLSLSALGRISLPGPPVEAVIALSILFLAIEIINAQKNIPILTAQKPWIVAFSFGLLHGLGFASSLMTIGLPQKHIPLALAIFNLGVEIGQLLFIAVVLLFIGILNKKKNWPIIFKKIPAYAIGSVSAFWLIDRIIGFWN